MQKASGRPVAAVRLSSSQGFADTVGGSTNATWAGATDQTDVGGRPIRWEAENYLADALGGRSVDDLIEGGAGDGDPTWVGS